MEKTTSWLHWLEKVYQISLCWEHYYQFAKSSEAQVSGKWYASMVASRDILQQLLSLSECYFRFKRFILLVQTKRVISMNYDRSTSSWKPWRRVRIQLIFTMRYIYINSNLHPLTESTSSSRNTEFKDILPRYISQISTKIIPISTRVVITCANEMEYSPFEFHRRSMETEAISWSEFPMDGKPL